MSDRKWILFFLEAIALLNVGAAYLLLLVQRIGRTPEQLEPYVLSVFIVIFPIWLMAVLVIVEFTRARRSRSEQSMLGGLDLSELKLLLRWCSLQTGIIASVSLLFSLAFSIGLSRIKWESSQAFTDQHVLGFSLGAILFCSLALPIFSSSRRMPGSFSDHF